MPEPFSAPKVLISYSHDSAEHMARVLVLSDRLRAEGIDSQLDQYETSPPEGWPRWTWNQVEWADFVLVVCTATYNRRFRGREEQGKGHGVNWEGVVITQDLYDAAARNTKFIPVVFSEEDAAHIPVILRGATFYVLDTEEGYEALYRHLSNQPRTQRPMLGKLRPLPQRAHHAPGDGHTWPATESAAAVAPRRTDSAEAEGDRAPSRRVPSGRKGLLILLAVGMGLAAAALGLWRYAFAPSRGGPVQFSGRVVANRDERVISGATVSLESGGVPDVSQTDSQGVFSLKLSRSLDEARIRIEAKGFEVYQQNVKLSTPGFPAFRLTEIKPPPTPTPTPAPTRTPRRPIIPRPSSKLTPCPVEARARGDC